MVGLLDCVDWFAQLCLDGTKVDLWCRDVGWDRSLVGWYLRIVFWVDENGQHFCATFWEKAFTFGKTRPPKSDFAFNSCVVHIRRKETASGDTEQTQKLLEARDVEWEARLKKKGMPLVTSFGGAKMFLSRCVETHYPCILVSRVASG